MFAEEKASGKKRKTYTGRSKKTAYRWKHVRKDLATQGYLPVHEFMQRMKSQKPTEKIPPTFEESEESSDDDAVTWSNEPRTSEGQVACSPAASKEYYQLIQGSAASEERLRVVLGLREEEEESTGSEGEDGGTAREDWKTLQAEMVRTWVLHYFGARLDGTRRVVLCRNVRTRGPHFSTMLRRRVLKESAQLSALLCSDGTGFSRSRACMETWVQQYGLKYPCPK